MSINELNLVTQWKDAFASLPAKILLSSIIFHPCEPCCTIQNIGMFSEEPQLLSRCVHDTIINFQYLLIFLIFKSCDIWMNTYLEKEKKMDSFIIFVCLFFSDMRISTEIRWWNATHFLAFLQELSLDHNTYFGFAQPLLWHWNFCLGISLTCI